MKRTILLLLFAYYLTGCSKEYASEFVNVEIQKTLLEDFWVTAIEFAPDNTVWIGTVEQGLIRLKEGKMKIFDSSNSDFPDSAWVKDIEIDGSGNLWIAAKGIIKYDGSTFTSYHSENSDLPENVIHDIEIDNKGYIWAASSVFRSGGVVRIDNADGWDTYTPVNSELPANSISSIAIDNDENVWLAMTASVNNGYLVKIDGDEWTIFGEEEFGFSPYWIREIDTDSQNRVWGVIDYSLSSSIFDYRPVLFSFDGKAGKTYIPDESFESFFTANIVSVDASDMIWIGGARTIGIMKEEVWISNFILPENQTVYAIAHKSDQEVWIGTSGGIVVLKTEMFTD